MANTLIQMKEQATDNPIFEQPSKPSNWRLKDRKNVILSTKQINQLIPSLLLMESSMAKTD